MCKMHNIIASSQPVAGCLSGTLLPIWYIINNEEKVNSGFHSEIQKDSPREYLISDCRRA